MSPSTSVTIRIPNETLNAIQIKMSEMPQAKNISTVIKESLDLWLNASNPTIDRLPQSRLESAITTIEPIELDYLDINTHDTWQEPFINLREALDDQIDIVEALNQTVAKAIADIRSIDLVVGNMKEAYYQIGKPDNDWLIDWQEEREKLDPGIDPNDDQSWYEHYKVPTVIKRLERLENAVGVLLRQQKDDRLLDRLNKNKKGFGT